MDDLLSVFGHTLFPVQVLLVDDDGAARRGVRGVLERHGYTVVEAVSGLEALTVLERSHVPVDLLISDIQMPGMWGDELVRRVRGTCPDLPVLYLSGDPAFASLADGTPGPSGFLAKPFEIADLLGAVRQVLYGSAPTPDEQLRPAVELDP